MCDNYECVVEAMHLMHICYLYAQLVILDLIVKFALEY